LSRAENVRLLAAMQERDRRQRVAPLFYYKGHSGQTRAHDAKARKRCVVIVCGNKWGKSYWSAAEIVAHLYGYRPWLVPGIKLTRKGDYPPRDKVSPEYWTRRADGVPTNCPAHGLVVTGLGLLQGIGNVMWPRIEELLPQAVKQHADFAVRRGNQGVVASVRFPRELSTGGSQLSFGTGEQNPMQFEGQDFTFAALDEPPKRGMFGGIWRGLTVEFSPMWLTMTPIGPNAPWVFEEFEARDRDDTEIIRGSIWENEFFSDEQKTEFLEQGAFLEEERAARESGTWTFFTHRAFPQFDPAAHIVPPQTPPPGWTTGLAIDPAHRRPYALLWAAFGPDGEVLIYDEWPEESHANMRSSSQTVKDYLDIIVQKEGTRRVDFRVLDPRFGAARPSIKGERHTSIQEDFAELDMYFDCRLEGTEREEIGIARIRSLLHWDRGSKLTPLNRPKLRVCSHCTNTIDALALSNFVPPNLREPDILTEKMMEQHKDFRDCLRYLILYPKIVDMDRVYSGYVTDQDLKEMNSDRDWF
jgi:hypothetical protein